MEKLHNKELHNLYSSPNVRIIKSRMRCTGHVARMGEIINANKIWLETLMGRDHSGYPNGNEDKVKMNHRTMRLEGADWIHLAQKRDWWRALVNTVINLRVP
jgi:hypothetical protein